MVSNGVSNGRNPIFWGFCGWVGRGLCWAERSAQDASWRRILGGAFSRVLGGDFGLLGLLAICDCRSAWTVRENAFG